MSVSQAGISEGLLTGWVIRPVWLIAIGIYALCCISVSLAIAAKNGFRHLFIMPAVFLTLHLGYGLGSLAGIYKLIAGSRLKKEKFNLRNRRIFQKES